MKTFKFTVDDTNNTEDRELNTEIVRDLLTDLFNDTGIELIDITKI